jgi:hypothetical protein|tara:strand:+ start:959 stop:1234 length:276 start_codon:yes stop_codon:yes gene_type:complete
MEWLEHNILKITVTIIVAAYWYDKKSRDERFKMLETRMEKAETHANQQQTQLEVMGTELKAFSKLTDAHLNHIRESIDKMFVLLDKQDKEK